ncbi:MAG: family 1 glycosylhydrolase, partial [Candidatus Saccharibacteria bacterium]|nr:family 1 glycosylhydrolase [Candidatus Saccharibacteria bacterium]
MPTRPTIAFPKNFLWGAATSAHQVEGGLNNQWTVWELENAKALATQAPYQFGDLPNW